MSIIKHNHIKSMYVHFFSPYHLIKFQFADWEWIRGCCIVHHTITINYIHSTTLGTSTITIFIRNMWFSPQQRLQCLRLLLRLDFTLNSWKAVSRLYHLIHNIYIGSERAKENQRNCSEHRRRNHRSASLEYMRDRECNAFRSVTAFESFNK